MKWRVSPSFTKALREEPGIQGSSEKQQSRGHPDVEGGGISLQRAGTATECFWGPERWHGLSKGTAEHVNFQISQANVMRNRKSFK